MALDRIVEAVEAPWGARIENQLRETWLLEELDPYVRSERLCDRIRELGLEPFEPPEPLPAIDLDDVQLICWMAVKAE